MREACIVPGCTSNARIPAHQFPKDSARRLLWLKKLKIENIEHVISLARCKVRICHKHFSEEDYIYSLNRRKLKDTAIPCLNIPNKIKCIAASNNIDSQEASTSACNLDFCPDIIAIEPQQPGYENHDIRHVMHIQEHNMDCNEMTQEAMLSNATEHVQHIESESTNLVCERHDKTLIIPSTSQEPQESNIRIFKRRTLLPDCRRQIELTPKAARLYKIAANLLKRKKYTDTQNVNLRRTLRINRLYGSNFIEQYEKLSKTQRILIQMQLRTAQQQCHIEQPHLSVCAERTDQPFNNNYMSMARRYTLDEKILALSLLQRSPRCYSLLQSLYNMPSTKTLKRLLQKVTLKPGICKIIIRYLRQKAKTMRSKEKYCLLMWDEMVLTPHIQYDFKNDIITGFEDWGMRRSNKFADYALVFMLRGLYSGWKMPISFGYCDSQTKTPQLLRCIKQIITVVNKSGFEIVATVCDQGSSNVSAINILLKDTARKLWKQEIEHRHIDTQIGPLSIPKEEAVIMSEVLQFFNKLFDSVNGYTIKPEAPLRVIIKENSAHHEFWKDAIRYLQAMKYVDPVSKKPLTKSLCLQNWIKTINAFQNLWTVLKERDFKQFKPRYINQDPLENFFGCIRSAGCRNINPTCTNFYGAYKVLLINNLSSQHTIGRNCEDICNGHLLFSLRDFISAAHKDDNKSDKIEDECAHIVESSLEKINKDRHDLEDRSLYAALKKNILIKALFKHCAACRASIINDANLQQILQRTEILIKRSINKFYFKSKIQSNIKHEIEEKIDFSFIKCQQHDSQLRTAILTAIISTCLKKFCIAVNRCLNGKCTSIVINPVLQSAQAKYRSRIKKKS